MLNRIKNCQFCGHYTTARFCCDRCRERYALKQAALKAPPVTVIVNRQTRRQKINELLNDWSEEHDCPEECGCADVRRMCEPCLGWENELKEEMLEEYQERLENMTDEELEKELDEPDW